MCSSCSWHEHYGLPVPLNGTGITLLDAAQAIVSTYEATQTEQAAEIGDLRAALAAVQAENLTLQVMISNPGDKTANGKRQFDAVI